MSGWVSEWMDGWMDGWVSGWMFGCMGGWVMCVGNVCVVNVREVDVWVVRVRVRGGAIVFCR